jgi:uncharacterized membrane protein (DUF4010 family)
MDASADVPALGIALGIGLLLGVERERHKGTGPGRGSAGVRTFALVALLGGLAAVVGSVALAVTGGFVALAAAASVLRSEESDPGITTEVALMIAFLLGALAQRDPGLAAGIGVAVGLILAYRDRLHRLVRDTLTEDEVHDGLLFAAAALIVLPLVPDEGLGPQGTLNPFTVWRLVVVVMAVQAAGYIALRVVGPRYGLLVSGFVGGFVSSTATVASMGTRATEQPELRRAAGGAAVVSTFATVLLLMLLLAATSLETLRSASVPLACAATAACVYGVVVARRAARHAPEQIAPGRAFDLKTPVLLAVTVVLVLLLAGVLDEALGRRGVVLGAAIAGFADLQSAGVSASTLVEAGRLSAGQAVVPVLAALTTSSASKAAIAYALGRGRYAIEVGLGLLFVVGAAWAGFAVTLAAA